MIPTPRGCRFIDTEHGATLDFDKRNKAWHFSCHGAESADALIELAALCDYAENQGSLYKCLV